jgi:tripartite-type tricarboxylate transporter receptor subunit TctC
LRKAADVNSFQRKASWLTPFTTRGVPFAARKRRPQHGITLTVIAWAVLTLQTAAADYPDRPIRVVVASAAGGGADVTTRIIVAELTRRIGKQFVVDNRPGAGGLIGMELIARAAPDGYTIGQGGIAQLAINRIFQPRMPYDPDRDIQSVAQYGASSNILAVALSLPVKSVQELIDHARRNPGKLLFASNGNGTSVHLSGELFKHMTGTQITHVPYKAAQQGVSDMIGGQIHLMFDNASSIGGHVRAGRVRGLAVTGAKRSSSYPELPTVADSGVPNFEVTIWAGIVAPAGVPKDIVNRLNAEINKALTTSTIKEKFGVLGTEPTGGTPAEFAALIKREVIKWTAVVKDANIKVD